MTTPDLELLKALVAAIDAAETEECVVDYVDMIKKLLSYYGKAQI